MQLIPPPLEIALCLIVTLYPYMHVFFFWGCAFRLVCKGPFSFSLQLSFLQSYSVRGYEQWNMQVQSIVFFISYFNFNCFSMPESVSYKLF